MIRTIPLNKLVQSSRNVRKHSDAAADAELAASIAALGLLQNRIARPGAKGKFEVEAGERRRRAMLALADDKVLDDFLFRLADKAPGAVGQVPDGLDRAGNEFVVEEVPLRWGGSDLRLTDDQPDCLDFHVHTHSRSSIESTGGGHFCSLPSVYALSAAIE